MIKEKFSIYTNLMEQRGPMTRGSAEHIEVNRDMPFPENF